jgi:hypothetical protein
VVGFREDVATIELLLLGVDVGDDETHEFLDVLNGGEVRGGFRFLEEED